MKGIILAGGMGTRLYPATRIISKQLLPVYDKPMIFYPLSTLMMANINPILIITTPHDEAAFQRLLGDGSQWGISLSYAVQEQPEGIAQAFIIAEKFINTDPICLILGDNIFHGNGLQSKLIAAADKVVGATIFSYYVSNPMDYGIIEFDPNGQPIHILEKPTQHISNYAVTGLYFYDNNVINIAKNLSPSRRNEIEITDINLHYLRMGQLSIEKLDQGFAWLDMGTYQSLLEASNLIHSLEQRQGLKIGSPDDIAIQMGLIKKLKNANLSFAN